LATSTSTVTLGRVLPAASRNVNVCWYRPSVVGAVTATVVVLVPPAGTTSVPEDGPVVVPLDAAPADHETD
jgi:hypothetical protein